MIWASSSLLTFWCAISGASVNAAERAQNSSRPSQVREPNGHELPGLLAANIPPRYHPQGSGGFGREYRDKLVADITTIDNLLYFLETARLNSNMSAETLLRRLSRQIPNVAFFSQLQAEFTRLRGDTLAFWRYVLNSLNSVTRINGYLLLNDEYKAIIESVAMNLEYQINKAAPNQSKIFANSTPLDIAVEIFHLLAEIKSTALNRRQPEQFRQVFNTVAEGYAKIGDGPSGDTLLLYQKRPSEGNFVFRWPFSRLDVRQTFLESVLSNVATRQHISSARAKSVIRECADADNLKECLYNALVNALDKVDEMASVALRTGDPSAEIANTLAEISGKIIINEMSLSNSFFIKSSAYILAPYLAGGQIVALTERPENSGTPTGRHETKRRSRRHSSRSGST